MPSICHACGNTGYETFDDTDRQGHLCTRSRQCRRCARRRMRHERISLVVAIVAFFFALGLSLWGGIPR